MEITNSKTVKNFILDPSNDLEELIDFCDINFKLTIEGIFNALFILLKHYNQNKSKIEYLIELIDELVEVKTIEEIKTILGPIKDLENKINDNFTLKQKINIKSSKVKIDNILNNINNKISLGNSNNKSKCIEYLIFQEKNLSMVESFLNTYKNILNTRDVDEINIFELILNKYIYLDEKNEEEINYYYHIIHLFINSQHGKSILKEKIKYINIIKKSKLGYKEHIIKVIELFDPDFKISMNEIENRYNIKFDFPNVIIDEINSFIMDNNNRIDFTNQECVTIDGKNDQCLDDSLYIEKNIDGTYTLYIHITDIPAFIPYNSLTNEEAKRRIETLYLRDRSITLYPEYISNYICSLLQNNNRNVISYIFKLDPNFNIIEDSLQIVKGKIKNKHKLSYEEVDEIIKNPTNSNLDQMLLLLFCFADKRRGQNLKKEEYRKYENFLRMEAHHESLKIDYSASANIIHEAMVLTNYDVGRYFKILSLPYMYRKVTIPSNDFIEKQLQKIIKMDPNITKNKEFIGLLRDSYMKTSYTSKPVFHKGLNVECYSHSTSPARRYADAFGQYIIHDLIFNNNLTDLNLKTWEYRIDELVKYINGKKIDNEMFSSQYNYLSYKKLIKEKKK